MTEEYYRIQNELAELRSARRVGDANDRNFEVFANAQGPVNRNSTTGYDQVPLTIEVVEHASERDAPPGDAPTLLPHPPPPPIRSPSAPLSPGRKPSTEVSKISVNNGGETKQWKIHCFHDTNAESFRPRAMVNSFKDKVFFYRRYVRELTALQNIEERVNAFLLEGQLDDYLRVVALLIFLHRIMIQHKVLKGKLRELEKAILVLIESRQRAGWKIEIDFEDFFENLLYYTKSAAPEAMQSDPDNLITQEDIEKAMLIGRTEKALVLLTMNHLRFSILKKKRTKTYWVSLVSNIVKIIIFIGSLAISLEITGL
jgi:hypothetical protein